MYQILFKNFWRAVILVFLFNTVTFGVDMPFDNDDVNLPDFTESPENKEVDITSDNGGKQIHNALFAIISWFSLILGSLATVLMVWQGFNLITAQGEELDNVKNSIKFTIGALVGSFLVIPLILNVIYGGGDVIAGKGILESITTTLNARLEAEGFMTWIKVFIGMGAVAMIIFTGIKSMFSTEDTTDAMKNNIISIVIGLIIIALNDVMIKFGLYNIEEGNSSSAIDEGDEAVEITRNSAEAIKELAGLGSFALTFFGVIAVAVIAYGGFLVVTASFNEEQADKGKAIMINVAIGCLIAFISYTLVRTLIFL